MKFSLESIRISIAGAKLSHLVQKDRIWDHGSMTEQVRTVFHLIEKAKKNGYMEPLRKYMTPSCFDKFEKQFRLYSGDENAVVTELAAISVEPGNQHRPDMFTVLIKGHNGEKRNESYDRRAQSKKFSLRWSFVREGEWWILNRI